MGISKFVALLSWGVYPPFSTQLPQYKCLLGATSIEKIPKISAFGQNFLDPSPYSIFGHTDENIGISYLKIIIKFGFFKIWNPPPPILAESQWPMILTSIQNQWI